MKLYVSFLLWYQNKGSSYDTLCGKAAARQSYTYTQGPHSTGKTRILFFEFSDFSL